MLRTVAFIAKKVNMKIKFNCKKCGVLLSFEFAEISSTIVNVWISPCEQCLDAARNRTTHEAEKQTCPDCDGEGSVWMVEDEAEICARCDGTGQV